MRVWADVYTPAGVLQGLGPITNIARVRATRVLDGCGAVALTVPAFDKRAQDTIAAERRLKVYTQHNFSQGSEPISFALTFDSPANIPVGNASGTHCWRGQSFTLVNDGYPIEAAFYHGARAGTLSGDMTLELRSYAGSVVGAVLQSWTYTPVDSSLNVITLTGVLKYAAGLYCFMLRPTTPQSSGNYWQLGGDSPSFYAGGTVVASNTSGSTWFTTATQDLYGYVKFQSRLIESQRLLGIGIVQKQRMSFSSGSSDMVIDGPDQIGELKDVNCWLNRAYNGVSVATIIQDLTSLATGWTSDTTGVPALTASLRFDGSSVLKAFQELCKRYGLHFRWSGDKALTFGPLGDDALVQLFQVPRIITPDMLENDDIAFVDRLTLTYDSETVNNVILPVGAEYNGAPLSMELSGRGGLSQSSYVYGIEHMNGGMPLEGPTSAGETITITASGSTKSFGFSRERETLVAQVVTLANPGFIEEITCRHGANVGIPSGVAMCEVRRFSTTIENEVLYEKSYIPTASATNTLTETSGPLLEAGTYALVWRCAVAQETSSAYALQCSNSSSYAGGSAWISIGGDGKWVQYSANDIQCSLKVSSLTPHLKIAVSIDSGWVTGGLFDHVVLYLKKVGDPTKDYRVRATEGSDPGGTEDAVSQDINGALISSTEYTPFTFIFDTPVNNTFTLWVELEGDGTADDDNYIMVAVDRYGSVINYESQVGDDGYITDAEYAESNLNAYSDLKRRTVATYGADQSAAGTYIENGHLTTYVGSRAFDNNTAQEWRSAETAAGVNGVSYVGQDFGVGVTKTVRRVRLWQFNGANGAVSSVKIEYSDDGAAWTTAVTATISQAIGNYQNVDVPASGAHRYWRVLANSGTASASWFVYEIEMLEAATYTDTSTEMAQTFQVTAVEPVKTVKIPFKKTGSPTGTVTVRIETVSGSDPTGTLVDAAMTATFSEADVLGAGGWVTVAFAAAWTPSVSTDYALRISTTRALSESDYISWWVDSSPAYASGDMRGYNGSAWASLSIDGGFQILSDLTTVWTGITPSVLFLAYRFDSSHTDLYDLKVMMGPDGAPLYYIKDDTSIAAYGRKERTFSVNIKPASDNLADVVAAASAIYDAAAAYLDRYKLRQIVYSVTLKKVFQTLSPGQMIKLTYKGYVYNLDGDKVTWLDVANEEFWIIQVTETGGADLTTSLEISNVDKAREDIATSIVNTLDRVSELLLNRT